MTCVNVQGSSVIDYVLHENNLFKFIHSFIFHDPNILSDRIVEFNRQFMSLND